MHPSLRSSARAWKGISGVWMLCYLLPFAGGVIADTFAGSFTLLKWTLSARLAGSVLWLISLLPSLIANLGGSPIFAVAGLSGDVAMTMKHPGGRRLGGGGNTEDRVQMLHGTDTSGQTKYSDGLGAVGAFPGVVSPQSGIGGGEEVEVSKVVCLCPY